MREGQSQSEENILGGTNSPAAAGTAWRNGQVKIEGVIAPIRTGTCQQEATLMARRGHVQLAAPRFQCAIGGIGAARRGDQLQGVSAAGPDAVEQGITRLGPTLEG